MESGKTSPNDSVGRASRYIKYAIGEILLVVIGILIALQINNWNENRKKLQQEEVIANELHLELLGNTSNINYLYNQAERRLNALTTFSDTLTTQDLVLEERYFDSLLRRSITFNPLSLNTGKFDKILESEDFKFTKNPKLIRRMQNLGATFDRMEDSYLYNVDTWKQTVSPFLLKKYPFRNMSFDTTRVRRSFDPKLMTDDPLFDNIISLMHADVVPFLGYLSSAKHHTSALIEDLEEAYDIEPTITKN